MLTDTLWNHAISHLDSRSSYSGLLFCSLSELGTLKWFWHDIRTAFSYKPSEFLNPIRTLFFDPNVCSETTYFKQMMQLPLNKLGLVSHTFWSFWRVWGRFLGQFGEALRMCFDYFREVSRTIRHVPTWFLGCLLEEHTFHNSETGIWKNIQNIFVSRHPGVGEVSG